MRPHAPVPEVLERLTAGPLPAASTAVHRALSGSRAASLAAASAALVVAALAGGCAQQPPKTIVKEVLSLIHI